MTELSMIGDPDAASCVDGICEIPAAVAGPDRAFSADQSASA
ncbi:MAG TPA: hypothetical protein VIQ78_06980 [Terrimesophilobacter sp.]